MRTGRRRGLGGAHRFERNGSRGDKSRKVSETTFGAPHKSKLRELFRSTERLPWHDEHLGAFQTTKAAPFGAAFAMHPTRRSATSRNAIDQSSSVAA
jgi:hypothetical protein